MLSKRLLKIAELVNYDKTVIDVGTDHALLPCFLMLNNKCKKVYASDNKEGPLKSAKQNIDKYNLDIETILMDGLNKCPKDVDEVIISGMGYYTVKHILDNADLNNKTFIIQINKHSNKLREYISEHNYTILNECIVKDDFYYEIIVFNNNYHEKYTSLEIEYGPINIKDKQKEFIDYLNFQLKTYDSFKTDKYQNKINEIKGIIYKEI